MKLKDLIFREIQPKPWEEGDNLPWNEPGFSARMLKEHLSQAHDHASRRFEIIDQHVDWIHKELLDNEAVPVLDLGCGPGLYSSRLSRFGHSCTGIDFSPASVDFARQLTQAGDSPCEYILDDIRSAEFGKGFGLAMLIYGEFNVFRPSDADLIVSKALKALNPGGKFLLEVSTCDSIYDMGHEPSTWYTAPSGLFSEKPHFCLTESFYDPIESVTTRRYFIIDAETSEINLFTTNYRALTHSEYQKILQKAGFENVQFYDSLNPLQWDEANRFLVVVAEKPR